MTRREQLTVPASEVRPGDLLIDHGRHRRHRLVTDKDNGLNVHGQTVLRFGTSSSVLPPGHFVTVDRIVGAR